MNRRKFLQQTSALGAASFIGWGRPALAEPPPETTKIRLVHAPAICLAPQYLAEDLLRLEGFTEVEYVKNWTDYPAKSIDEGRADFTQDSAPILLPSVESGGSAVALAGVHSGCYELMARESVRSIRDLRGKTISINVHDGANHILMASILAYVGIDPRKDVNWISGSAAVDAMALYVDGKADAFLALAPQGYALRQKRIGRVILTQQSPIKTTHSKLRRSMMETAVCRTSYRLLSNTAVDRPWSQYFCCMLVGHRQYINKYPVATKRAMRAFLKATDLCDRDPQRAARMLVDRGFEPHYQVALSTLKELSYSRWRESSPEDTLRFHAVRLYEVGMIKSSPQKIIEHGTDWRFLNELKKELKA